MTRGIGTDIVDISRIRGMVARYGDHFTAKVFTGAEREYCCRMADPALHYSGRWAAKEAFYKALPDECQPLAGWKSIEVVPGEPSRRPVVRVTCDDLRKAMAAHSIFRIHLSISHEKSFCIAFVVFD